MSTLKVDTLQNSVGENLVFGNKNLLINGGMNIFQRSTSQASITANGYYTADRWRIAANGLGTWTQSRSTDVPSAQGFGYSLKMDCTTADASPAATDLLILQQKIEGQNLQHLLKGTSSAKKVTLSFWVKSNKTGTYIIEIDHETASRSISKSYTISSADTWEKKEITFDGDTSSTIANDNAIGLSILWWLGAGSNRTSGSLGTSWASTTEANRAVGQVNLADSTSNEWYMTGCQLEVGSKATDFEFEPYANTLQKCQRYLYRYDSSDNVFARIANGTVRSTTCHIPFSMKVTMRSAPTLESISAASTFRVAGASSIATCTSIALNESGRDVVGFNFVTASSSLGDSGWASPNNTTSAFFNLSSEL